MKQPVSRGKSPTSYKQRFNQGVSKRILVNSQDAVPGSSQDEVSSYQSDGPGSPLHKFKKKKGLDQSKISNIQKSIVIPRPSHVQKETPGAMSKNTFTSNFNVTSNYAGRESSPLSPETTRFSKSRYDGEEIKAMPKYKREQQRAFSLFQDLNQNLYDIDQLYQNQIEAHEQAFLAAYQGHMRHVMDEVTHLKKQLTEREFRIKKDQRVAELSQQVNWFRNEALSLKNDLEQKKQVSKHVKDNNFILSEEKFALEQALGKQQLKTKALTQCLEKTKKNTEDMLQVIRDQQMEIQKLKKNEIKRQVYDKAYDDTHKGSSYLETAQAFKSHKITENQSLLTHLKTGSDHQIVPLQGALIEDGGATPEDAEYAAEVADFQYNQLDIMKRSNPASQSQSEHNRMIKNESSNRSQRSQREDSRLPDEIQQFLKQDRSTQDQILLESEKSRWSSKSKASVHQKLFAEKRAGMKQFLGRLFEHSKTFSKKEIIQIIEEFHKMNLSRYETLVKKYQNRIYKRKKESQFSNCHFQNLNFNFTPGAAAGDGATTEGREGLEDNLVFGNAKFREKKEEPITPVLSHESELLRVFKKCVEQLNKDRRKMKPQTLNRTAMRAAQRVASASLRQKQQSTAQISRSKSSFFGGATNIGGIGTNPESQRTSHKDLGVYNNISDDLKPHEKRAIVSYFLHSDEIFQHLCQRMFSTSDYGVLKREEAQELQQRPLTTEQQQKITSRNAQLLEDPIQMLTSPQVGPISGEINIFSENQEQLNPDEAIGQLHELVQPANNFFITEQEFSMGVQPSPPKTQLNQMKPSARIRPLSGYPTVGIKPAGFSLPNEDMYMQNAKILEHPESTPEEKESATEVGDDTIEQNPASDDYEMQPLREEEEKLVEREGSAPSQSSIPLPSFLKNQALYKRSLRELKDPMELADGQQSQAVFSGTKTYLGVRNNMGFDFAPKRGTSARRIGGVPLTKIQSARRIPAAQRVKTAGVSRNPQSGKPAPKQSRKSRASESTQIGGQTNTNTFANPVSRISGSTERIVMPTVDPTSMPQQHPQQYILMNVPQFQNPVILSQPSLQPVSPHQQQQQSQSQLQNNIHPLLVKNQEAGLNPSLMGSNFNMFYQPVAVQDMQGADTFNTNISGGPMPYGTISQGLQPTNADFTEIMEEPVGFQGHEGDGDVIIDPPNGLQKTVQATSPQTLAEDTQGGNDSVQAIAKNQGTSPISRGLGSSESRMTSHIQLQISKSSSSPKKFEKQESEQQQFINPSAEIYVNHKRLPQPNRLSSKAPPKSSQAAHRRQTSKQNLLLSQSNVFQSFGGQENVDSNSQVIYGSAQQLPHHHRLQSAREPVTGSVTFLDKQQRGSVEGHPNLIANPSSKILFGSGDTKNSTQNYMTSRTSQGRKSGLHTARQNFRKVRGSRQVDNALTNHYPISPRNLVLSTGTSPGRHALGMGGGFMGLSTARIRRHHLGLGSTKASVPN